MVESFDLEKLLIDVFGPQPGEKVLVMTDLPHGEWTDNEKWAARREMAQEWRAAFQQLGTKLGLSVFPLLTYAATGAHSAPLPEEGEIEGQRVRLDELILFRVQENRIVEVIGDGPQAAQRRRVRARRSSKMANSWGRYYGGGTTY